MPLIGQNTGDDVVFIAMGTILLAVILGLLRAACSRPAFSQVVARLRDAIKASRAQHGKAVDEVDIIVRDKLQKQKVDHLRGMFQITSIVLVPFTFNYMLVILHHGVRAYTVAQDIIYLTMHGVATVVLIHPGILSQKTLDLFYAIFLLLLCAFIAPFACQPVFLGESLQVVTFAMAIATFLRRTSTPLVPILNVLLTSAACSSIWVHGEGMFLRPHLTMILYIMAVLFVTAGAHMLEKGSVVMMRQCMDMQATQEILSASCTLLRSYCDVVVDLDSEGVIVSPAMDLGSFLLRGPSQCLQGSKIADLMVSEADQRSFMDRLRAPNPGGTGFAEALHTSMKDGNGDILDLELLWFQFRRLDDRPYYMIGIREFCDAVGRRREHPGHQAQEPEDLSEDGDMTISEDEEGFSLRDAASVSARSQGRLAAVAVVDAFSEGLPVRGLSSGFCMRIGRLPLETPLIDLVRKRSSFLNWVQKSINAVAAHEEAEDLSVRLRMPQGEMQATCRILPDRREAGHLDITRVRILFSGIGPCHGRGARSEAARLRGTPVSLLTL